MIPVCVALTGAVVSTLRASVIANDAWNRPSPQWGLVVGFLLWTALFVTVPRPIRAYVLAHELSHALWALLLGERVAGLRVTSRGGSVQIGRSRFLVLLAPYFFPLYTLIVIAAYGAIALVGDPTPWTVWWLAAVGFTWGFHLTFTISTLAAGQSDIRAAGPLPAYTTIYFMNLAGLALWISAVSPVRLMDIVLRTTHYLYTWAGAVCRLWS
jgi:hypothetical protein